MMKTMDASVQLAGLVYFVMKLVLQDFMVLIAKKSAHVRMGAPVTLRQENVLAPLV